MEILFNRVILRMNSLFLHRSLKKCHRINIIKNAQNNSTVKLNLFKEECIIYVWKIY